MFTEYSLWFLPLILIIAVGFAYFIYFFRQKKEDTFSKKQKYLLFALRFLGVFLILFLFVSPVKRIKHKIIEKPTIVLLQDNSSSLQKTKFSNSYKTKYVKDLDKLAKNLSKDYNVVRLLMGSKTTQLKDEVKYADTLRFNDFATNISQSLDFVSEEFSSENLSALILATDGIATIGNNYLNYSDKFSCPIYTVAMGDTTIRKDVLISDIQYNKIAFIDTDYPIEVTIKATKAINSNSTLFMVKDNKVSKVQSFSINNDNYSITAKLNATSKKAGIEKISFYVSEIDGESNKINNRKDIFIEVLDTKKKILVWAPAPHPDISGIRTALNNNENCEIDVNILSSNNNMDSGKQKNLMDYDVIILHSLPNNSATYKEIKDLQDKGKSMLFVVGQGTNIQMFNALNMGIQIKNLSSSFNDVLPYYNSSFSLFTLSDNITNILKNMPPLLSISAKYQLNSNIQTLLFQKIGAISTTYPLIAYNNEDNSKKAFILGENIWRWRLENYLIDGTTNQIDELITKTIQLISTKTNKNRFRIEHKDIYEQNEDVIFSAQFYNENFEMINTPEVMLKVTGANISNSYTFGKNNNAYYLNLSRLPQGEYSFSAQTTYNHKKYKQDGKFVVSQNDMELSDLVAKHSMLYTLSQKTNASMVEAQNILNLEKLIKQNDTIKPIVHLNQEYRKFVSLWWYWLLIILSLGSEWFLRRYWGKL
jgi:hypothetical protein